jgi:Helix-turn-helix domain
LDVPHLVESARWGAGWGGGHGWASSGGYAGKEQLRELQLLAGSERRGEADRARAIILSVNGWTSGQIARAFGVTPDSVRRWRGWFAASGVAGLRASERTGPEPTKSKAASVVAEELLAGPVADRPNWTLPRLQGEIA